MECSNCSKSAIIFLHYVRKHLCKQHFLEMFTKRFRSTVRKFNMVKKSDRIVVGLSGGKDSTVLLHCLHELSQDLPFELLAVTVDEGIANYRDSTLKIAKKEAKRLGIELKVVSFKEKFNRTLDSILRKDPSRSCTYCGVLRRGLLNRAARELRADKLAIGHNLDDVAQTFLMNLIRAEPSRIGRYLDPQSKDGAFVQRIRPLLRTPEKEIAVYAMAKKIRICHRECPYADNALRQTVRRQLNEMEEEYPGSKFKILSSFLEVGTTLRDKRRNQLNEVQWSIEAPLQLDPKLKTCACGEPTSSRQCKFCELVHSIK